MKLKARFTMPVQLIMFFLLILLIRSFVFSIQKVEGASMQPALKAGDFILINKLARDFKVGDIVVSAENNVSKTRLVKRIMALPNSKIYVDDYAVFINDQPVSLELQALANWDKNKYECRYSEIYETKNEEYFLMGDNRCNSEDSRSLGPFIKKDIIGKLVYKF